MDAFSSPHTRELLPFLRTAPSTERMVHNRSAVAATQVSTRQYFMNNAHEFFCRQHDHGLFFAATALLVPLTVLGVRYESGEQYLMSEKARLFHETSIYSQIMATPRSRGHKSRSQL